MIYPITAFLTKFLVIVLPTFELPLVASKTQRLNDFANRSWDQTTASILRAYPRDWFFTRNTQIPTINQSGRSCHYS